MSIEKDIDQLALDYMKKAEGRVAIMSPQDIAKIVKDAAHQGAMLGYAVGLKTNIRSSAKDLQIAELTVAELTERVKQLEIELISQHQ